MKPRYIEFAIRLFIMLSFVLGVNELIHWKIQQQYNRGFVKGYTIGQEGIPRP